MKVRLLVFSGRPNPEWDVEGGEADELRQAVDGTTAREETNAPPLGGLGYQGFELQEATPKGRDFEVVTVFKGVVTARGGGKTRHWRDTSGLESRLLASAREHGYGPTLDAAGAPQR